MEKKNQVFNLGNVILKFFKISPFITTLLLVEMVITPMVTALQIISFAIFIDTVLDLSAGIAQSEEVFLSLAIILFTIVYLLVIGDIRNLLFVRLEITVKSRLSVELIEKCASLQYKHIESQESLDLISRMTNDGDRNFVDLFRYILKTVQLILRVSFILLIIYVNANLAAIVIAIISIPLFLLAMKSGKTNYEADVQVAKFKRRYEYFSKVLLSRESVDERALFNFTENMNSKWSEQHKDFRKVKNRTIMKNNIRIESGSIVTAFINIIIILILLNALFNGHLTVGMFIALTMAIVQIMEVMSWELVDIVDKMTNYLIFIKDINRFFDLSEETDALAIPVSAIEFKTLEFRNVKFRYTEDLPYILKGLSLKIEQGKHYALVGVNGAGKTTIIKLLSGLYSDYEGEILINDKELSTYSLSEIKALTAIVYQDFAKYSISFEENIRIGSVDTINDKDMSEVIKASGLEDTVKTLKFGIKTNLGRIKSESQELSGGQWQKLAIARNLVRKSGLTILDEPTASLDPLMENRLYEDFDKISRGRTTLFISHRLGSTKLADSIYVIGDGRVLESGSHTELMTHGGIYNEMYESQRKWYE